MTDKDTPPGAAGLGIWGNLGVWVAFGSLVGLLFGPLFGGLFDNIAYGVALGAGLGVVVGAVFIARKNAHRKS